MSKKLTQSDADLIRVFYEEIPKISKSKIAAEYGVHVDTIRNIVNGKSFAGNTATHRNKARKLSNEQVIQIRCLSKLGYKPDIITAKMDHVVSKSTIRQVVEGKSYKDVELTWEFGTKRPAVSLSACGAIRS